MSLSVKPKIEESMLLILKKVEVGWIVFFFFFSLVCLFA